jgi:isopenicillin-N N-acyltransferase-like protein
MASFSRREGAERVVPMFPEVTVAGGSPYSRGKTYGSRVPELIERSIATYARLFAYRRGMDWAASQEEALTYLQVLQEGASEVLEEMRGIADGSGRKLSEILALNVRTELLAGHTAGHVHPGWQEALFANSLSTSGVPQSSPDDSGELLGSSEFAQASATTRGEARAHDFGECTTAAAQPAATTMGATILAQTWDWQGDQRAACVLLRIYESGQPDILTCTEAGMVAKHGLNSEGVAIGLNMMRSKTDGQHVGMPIHVLMRKMLKAKTFEEARAIPKAHRSAASSCIVVACRDGNVAALEITPAGVAEVPAQNGRLVHTNHALHPDMTELACPIGASNSTRDRHQRASQLLMTGSGPDGKLHLDDFKAILSDHQGQPRCICRHPDKKVAAVDRTETVCALIFDLGVMGLHVAPHLPCSCQYETILLDFPTATSRGDVALVIADSCSLCVPA